MSYPIKTIFFLLLPLYLALGNVVGKNSDVSPKKLRKAPEQAVVQGVPVKIEAYLWRDFMPISPPEGKPLRVVVKVKSLNESNLPAGLTATRVWVIKGTEMWQASLKLSGKSGRGAPKKELEAFAGGGPRWAPKSRATVVVELKDSKGNTYLLRAANQVIHRTM